MTMKRENWEEFTMPITLIHSTKMAAEIIYRCQLESIYEGV